MFDHQRPQSSQFVGPEAARSCKAHWFEPELGDIVTALDVYMRRFRPFETVKEESIAFNP
jgi:hypothetical protein